jgi:hypothetical protein
LEDRKIGMMEEWKNGWRREEKSGRMEWWNDGLGEWKTVCGFPSFQHSIIPTFQSSNIPSPSRRAAGGLK